MPLLNAQFVAPIAPVHWPASMQLAAAASALDDSHSQTLELRGENCKPGGYCAPVVAYAAVTQWNLSVQDPPPTDTSAPVLLSAGQDPDRSSVLQLQYRERFGGSAEGSAVDSTKEPLAIAAFEGASSEDTTAVAAPLRVAARGQPEWGAQITMVADSAQGSESSPSLSWAQWVSDCAKVTPSAAGVQVQDGVPPVAANLGKVVSDALVVLLKSGEATQPSTVLSDNSKKSQRDREQDGSTDLSTRSSRSRSRSRERSRRRRSRSRSRDRRPRSRSRDREPHKSRCAFTTAYIDEQLKIREAARRKKDYRQADQIREALSTAVR